MTLDQYITALQGLRSEAGSGEYQVRTASLNKAPLPRLITLNLRTKGMFEPGLDPDRERGERAVRV